MPSHKWQLALYFAAYVTVMLVTLLATGVNLLRLIIVSVILIAMMYFLKRAESRSHERTKADLLERLEQEETLSTGP